MGTDFPSTSPTEGMENSDSQVSPIEVCKRTNTKGDSLPHFDPINTAQAQITRQFHHERAPGVGNANALKILYYKTNHCHFRLQTLLTETIIELMDLSEVHENEEIISEVNNTISRLDSLLKLSIEENQKYHQFAIELNNDVDGFGDYVEKNNIKFEITDLSDESIGDLINVRFNRERDNIKQAQELLQRNAVQPKHLIRRTR
jgi:hypothetical protein